MWKALHSRRPCATPETRAVAPERSAWRAEWGTSPAAGAAGERGAASAEAGQFECLAFERLIARGTMTFASVARTRARARRASEICRRGSEMLEGPTVDFFVWANGGAQARWSTAAARSCAPVHHSGHARGRAWGRRARRHTTAARADGQDCPVALGEENASTEWSGFRRFQFRRLGRRQVWGSGMRGL